MPTQVITAVARGSSKATLQRLESPRSIMAGALGQGRVSLLLGKIYLPGARATGGSRVILNQLALGHPLTATGVITIGGSARLGLGQLLSAAGGITIGGSARLVTQDATLFASGGVTISGAAQLSAGVTLGTG